MESVLWNSYGMLVCTLDEYIPESHFCATPDGTGNANICPEDEATSPVVVSKRSRKDGNLNLRKSLAWNPAFFTEEGVLDSSELPIITDSVTKSNSKLLSMAKVESSSMIQLDKLSKRPPLNNLEEVFLGKEKARPVSRRSGKRANDLLSISEASKHDGPHMPMTSRKTLSAKGITRNVPKLDAAGLMLEKEKTEKVQIENYASIFKLNSFPSSSNRSRREMSCSAPTGTTCLVKEKAQNSCRLAPTPIQANQSTLRTPSSYGWLKKEKTTTPLFEKDPKLLKSCPSSSTTLPIETTCSSSAGIISSISQQTFNVPRLPPQPIQAKPSALRMPSPSLGFFQQKMVTSLHSDHLYRTSHVSITNTQSVRELAILKRIAPKPPVAQTEQYPKKDFEADAYMETKQFDKKGTISSNNCRRSNCLPDVAKEITNNCFIVSHGKAEKTREVLLGKSYTGRTTERADENYSNSQISSKPLNEGSEMVKKLLHFNCFVDTSASQHSVSCNITEICPTSSKMHFPQSSDESISKSLSFHAPVMNVELVMHKDAKDETYADTSLEKLQCISAVRGASGEASLYIESGNDPTEDGGVRNAEEHFHNTRSQVHQTISGKSKAGEMHANSSHDVQLLPPEECQPQEDLQLCESRNGTSSPEENGLLPAKRIYLENLKQDSVLSSAVPYSDEWLAAIEAFGEEILEAKTGTVHNSPPDKDVPEPGPWSPVKRKAPHVGPFDCTKYSAKSFQSDD